MAQSRFARISYLPLSLSPRRWRGPIARAAVSGPAPRAPLSLNALESRESPSEAFNSLSLPGSGLPATATTISALPPQTVPAPTKKSALWDDLVDVRDSSRGKQPVASAPTATAAPAKSRAGLDAGGSFAGSSASRPAPSSTQTPATSGDSSAPATSSAQPSLTPAGSNSPSLAPALDSPAPASPSLAPQSHSAAVQPNKVNSNPAPAAQFGAPAPMAATLLYPSFVLDANKGAVLTESAPNRDFSAWAADLKAQVSGAAVASYAWNLSGAPDATSVTGASTYRLQFTWASFTGAARSEAISLTTTFAGGGTQTQTFNFRVDATNSPAWSSSPPTTSASFPSATTEDLLFGEPAASGANYALGLATGRATVAHALPAYNPDVPALSLVYASTAAEARPIVRVRYAIPDGATVPATVTAQLTFNGVVSPVVTYGTTGLNAGDVLEFALQADATGLATGRYDYSVAVVGPLGGGTVGGGGPLGSTQGGSTNGATPIGGGGGGTTTTTYSGRMDVVNEAQSAYGAGWTLSGVRRLTVVSDGVVVESPGGVGQFRAMAPPGGGGGLVTSTQGPGDFSDLARNADGSYTQTLTDGNKINYSSAGLQTSVVDRDGNTTSYAYTSGKLTTITDRHGLVTTLAYDANGRLSSVTDPASRVTGFTVTSGKLTTITDADTHAWGYGYDAASRLTTITDPTSKQTVITYGAGGRATSAKWGTGAAETLTPQAAFGLAVAPQGTASNPAPAVLAAASTAVHADHRGNATVTRFDWSGFGSAVRMDAPDGGVSVALRDANDLPWLSSDPLGRRTRGFFDAKGNPAEVVNADDSYSTATYNASAEPLVATDELGHATTNAYNAKGDLITVTDALSKQTTRTYNADGTVATQTDPLSHTTTYGYDTRGRLTTQTDALNHAVTFGYDVKGNKTSGTDALSHGSTVTYDAMNRPLTSTDAKGGVTTDVYDAAGRLLTLTDPDNNTTTYAYSSVVDKAATATDPLNHATTYGYDADGHLIQVTDRDGRVRSFTFDSVGRPTGETWQATAGGATTYTESVSYDAAGQLLGVSDPFSAYSYTYDARGRVRTEDNAGTPGVPHVVLTDGYDAAGNLTSVSDSLGGVVGYSYSVRNELAGASETVSGALGANAAFGYDAAGRQTGVTRKEGTGGATIGTTLGYDNANRLASIAHTSSAAGALSSLGYGYDAADRLTSYTGPDGSLGYTYDNANQLTGVTGSASESFGYDANGNRNTTGYSTTGGNRLASDGTYNYGYDAEGNRTSKTRISDGQVTTYTFDNRNRVTDVQVKTAGGVLLHDESYTFDSQGRRLGVNSDGAQTWTLYKGDNAYADFNSSGALQTRYLFGLSADGLIARTSAAGSVAWYLADNLGSVRQVVTTAGSVLYSAAYTAYGQVRTSAGAGGDRFGYAGREWSRVTGEGYYRARLYDPAAGRFTSEDTIGFRGQDANLYRYVGNSPSTRTDPSGNIWPIFLIPIVTFVVGAVLGAVVTAVAAGGGVLIHEVAVYMQTGQPVNWKLVRNATIGGAVGGAVVGGILGSPWVAAVAIGALGPISAGALGTVIASFITGLVSGALDAQDIPDNRGPWDGNKGVQFPPGTPIGR